MNCKSCGEEKRILARGWCSACYNRWRKRGTTEYAPKRERQKCSIEGCAAFCVSHGLCDKHRKRVSRHGHTSQTRPADWGERTSHPLYKLWHGMIRRCEEKSNKDYVNYGARGIRVCERWHDFWKFLEDMGERPSPSHSIDREDCDGHYEPDNCHWATPAEQARNKRTSVITEEVANEIKARSQRGEMAGDISRSMRIEYYHVRNVIVGMSWAD